ncbi:lipopolysaccharide biosynthesis protein [Sphingomonas sp. Leaf4]|uniref:lipopolysaccharide biosynthesis protein n=1 Tax=Sphingomonas sp. Leaf4 TaxID=2876553 RepID=UPI001E52AB27|nr:lipopolysaccharide biosynthesis protein [Sphingomonas sp. Leaf4]
MRLGKGLIAGLWSSIDLGMRFFVQFVVSIVLARLLSPTDFGIYALTAVFIALSTVLIDGGFSSAIIQKKEVSAEEQTAVFWYNLTAAALIAAGIALVAPSMADWFGHPVLRPLLYVTAIVVPLAALASVPAAMLQRHLRFDLVAKAGLTASLISGMVAIVAALNGAGIWSFAIQALVNAFINTVLVWILGGWRPLGRPHLRAARELAGFGSLVALSGLLEVAYAQGSLLIIGKLHGARDLGFYNRAQNLQNLPSGILAAIVTRVALPIFSTKSDDVVALRRGVRLAQGVVMLINLPLMGALAVMPDLLIEVLYGPKWLFAAPILSVLAIGGVLFPLHSVNLQLILAQGRSDLYLKVELVKKCIGIAFVGVGSLFGIMGLAVGQTLFVYIAFFINAGVAGRLIGYPPLAQLRDLAGTVVLTLTMVALLAILRPLLAFGSFFDLAILTVAGGGFYVVVALLLRVGASGDLIGMTPLARLLPARHTA